jgi:class 3 adenylate cyclase
MEPRIQYAKTTDGVSIAFCMVGEGTPLLWVSSPPFCHVQLDWQTTFSYWFQPLARNHRVVWFDWPGTGLSDRDAIDFSMDAMVRSIEAVVARTGLEKFALSTSWSGALIAVTYAAARPKRVSHLILVDGWTKFSEVEGSAVWQAEKALRDKDWVIYTETFARVLWGVQDQEFARQVAEYVRACVEPDAYRAAVAAMEHYDVSALLPKVTAPTLVVQNQKSPWVPVQTGQRLAARIANSRFLVVEDPTLAQMPALIDEFLSEGEQAAVAPAEPPAAGAFRTVLFTDVEGSTSLTQRLGDAKAREVLRTHDHMVREALKAHGGTEVKTMGDGFMASFSSATRALECAIAMQQAFAEHNESAEEPMRVRVGLNAGEPIAEDEDLFGTAVIMAARIAAKAEGREILASDVVRQLVAGKGFLFSDRGDVVLRGFEDPVRLYEVRWREEV